MKLHDYQEVAVGHLHRNPRAGLFLDMGLGKTATVLSALTEDHLPALVVAPKRVAENVWHVERRKWRPDLRISVAAGDPRLREKMLRTRADIYVISRDNIGDVNRLWPKGHPFKTIVLDELSSFKGRGVRWRHARKIVKGVPHVWGLTGTPAPNGLLDLWAQIFLLDAGKRLGQTLTSYRTRYFIPGQQLPSGTITRWDPRPEAPKRIHKLLEDICLSMSTEGRVVLPPTTINTVEVPLTPAVRKQYKTLKKDQLLALDMIGGDRKVAALTAASLSTKLAQLTAGFLYVDDEDTGERVGAHRIHSEKIKAVQEIIDGTGSPVLVFYRFQEEREMLLEAIDGAEGVERDDVFARWNEGKVPVLVAHPASIGHGLNLQDGGHTIIWTTATWSLEEWDQSNKRLARQGQQNPVIIHVLSSPGTVDEAVVKALKAKTSVQRALLDHLESPL